MLDRAPPDIARSGLGEFPRDPFFVPGTRGDAELSLPPNDR